MRRGITARFACAGAAALAAAPAVGALSHHRHAVIPARVHASSGVRARWRALPSLPGAAQIDIDGASVVTAHGHVIVSVVSRAASEASPSQVLSFKWSGHAWRSVGGPLAVNRGARVDLFGGRRACIAGPTGRAVRVWCMGSDRRWHRVGGAAFRTTAPSPVTGYDGAFIADGKLIVIKAHVRDARSAPGSAGISGRLEHMLYAFNGARWQPLTRGQLDASATNGTQRPFGFDGSRPCVAYDALPRDRAQSPTIRIRCIGDRGRLHTMRPALTSSRVAAGAGRRGTRIGIDVDGATVAGGVIFLGVDEFVGRHVKWPVMALRGGRWSTTPLGADSSWDAQGSLYTIAGWPWAIQFDQRDEPDMIRTRLIVRRLLPDGTAATVGQPLIENAKLVGPLYWGLTLAQSKIYAMATLPNTSGTRDEVRVLQLDERSR